MWNLLQAGLSGRVPVIQARIRAEGRDFDEHISEFIRVGCLLTSRLFFYLCPKTFSGNELVGSELWNQRSEPGMAYSGFGYDLWDCCVVNNNTNVVAIAYFIQDESDKNIWSYLYSIVEPKIFVSKFCHRNPLSFFCWLVPQSYKLTRGPPMLVQHFRLQR